jgi:hypothetical protein
MTTTAALPAEDTVKAFGQAGELAKKFRSAGADYYGCRSSRLAKLQRN